MQTEAWRQGRRGRLHKPRQAEPHAQPWTPGWLAWGPYGPSLKRPSPAPKPAHREPDAYALLLSRQPGPAPQACWGSAPAGMRHAARERRPVLAAGSSAGAAVLLGAAGRAGSAGMPQSATRGVARASRPACCDVHVLRACAPAGTCACPGGGSCNPGCRGSMTRSCRSRSGAGCCSLPPHQSATQAWFRRRLRPASASAGWGLPAGARAVDGLSFQGCPLGQRASGAQR